MSKPMLVTVPFLLLLLDYWPLRRLDWPAQSSDAPALQSFSNLLLRLALEKVPFFLLAVASSMITFLVQRHGGALYGGYTISMKIANSLVSYSRYLGKTFWPEGLAVFYPHPGSWPLWQVVGSAALLMGITFAAITMARKRPYLLVGWLWFVGAMVPVLGLVQVGAQSMADRYTYVPLIGFFVAVTWAVADFASERRFGPWPLPVAGLSLLAICATLTCLQLRVWQNSETLFRHAAAVTRDNEVAYYNLGFELLGQRRTKEAVESLRMALKIDPADEDALSNLGVALATENKLDEAVQTFQRVLELRPNEAQAINNLATVLSRQGRLAEAELRYRDALRLNPGDATAHLNLGLVLGREGKTEQAAAEFAEALRLAPEDPDARRELASLQEQKSRNADALCEQALALAKGGETALAAMRFREALQLSPNRIVALNNLAWILATDENPAVRNGTEAVRLAERACELTGYADARALGTLDAAYAEAGQFAKAIEMAQKTRDLALADNKKELADAARDRLRLYEAGKPFRQTGAHSRKESGEPE